MKNALLYLLTALALGSAGLGHAGDDQTVASNATANGKPGTEGSHLSSDHIGRSESSDSDTIVDPTKGSMRKSVWEVPVGFMKIESTPLKSYRRGA